MLETMPKANFHYFLLARGSQGWSFSICSLSWKLGKTPWFIAQKGSRFPVGCWENKRKQEAFAHEVVLLLCSKNRASLLEAGNSVLSSFGLCWKARFPDFTIFGLLKLLISRYLYFLNENACFFNKVLFLSHLKRECFCFHLKLSRLSWEYPWEIWHLLPTCLGFLFCFVILGWPDKLLEWLWLWKDFFERVEWSQEREAPKYWIALEFFTIAAVFLVRKVIRCLWMFQKTKGKKADSMLKYPLGDP